VRLGLWVQQRSAYGRGESLISDDSHNMRNGEERSWEGEGLGIVVKA